MQPEDQKSDFQQPQATNYFSPAPVEDPGVASEPQPVAETSPAVTPAPAAPSEEETPTPAQEPAAPRQPEQEPVQWQAPEYLHHEKNPLWFVVFGLVVIGLTAAAIFLMQSWTFALLIPVMAVALVAYSHRPPRMMDYVLSGKGLYINDTLHPFAEFKSFGVIHDDHEYSVVFIPVRRFRPSLTVYFPADKGEAVVDLLGVRLPMQPLKLDAFDKIVRLLGL
ncbi:MAG: hypothetical protein JWM00_119 [Candidatus Saccharibacteria bacterium]|nr:hypothetical protein [Candidatus Saccharibacteria bacterium]